MARLTNFLFSITRVIFFINKFFGSNRKKTLVGAVYEGFVTAYGLEVEAGLWNSSSFTSKGFILLYLLASFPDLKLFPFHIALR